MTPDILAGDVRLLSKHEAQQRVLELLESEDRMCARIRELEGRRMSWEDIAKTIDSLRIAADIIASHRGTRSECEEYRKDANARRALADRLACGLLEKTT